MKLTTSVVTGRTQQVLYRGCLSAVQPVQYGVPEGPPVLGPTLFVLCTAEIGRIVAQPGLKFHQYADDCQIYVATSVSAVHSSIDQLSRCLYDVWMSASRLRLHERQQDTMLCLSSRHNIDKLSNSRFVRYQSCRLLSASSAQHVATFIAHLYCNTSAIVIGWRFGLVVTRWPRST